EGFGRFSFVFSITQLLLMDCDLGLHNTAIRKIAFYAAQPDKENQAATAFGTFFSLKVIVSLAFIFSISAASLLFSQTNEMRAALVLFSAGMFIKTLNTALNMTFQAHGKLYL